MLARGRTREQHRCEIHHQHEHEEHAGEPKNQQGRADAGDQVRLESDWVQPQAAVLERARVDNSTDGVHRRHHRLERCAATRANQTRIVAGTRRRLCQPGVKGDVGICALGLSKAAVHVETEVRPHDANDRIRLPVQPHIRADDRRISTEPLPQLVRQHDHRWAAGAHFGPRKAATECRPHAEHVEQVR